MPEPILSWEKRSNQYGADYRAVLFRSLPPVLNQYIHDWHLQQVIHALRPALQNGTCRILDVGCGYGRVTMELQRLFPEVKIIGLDVAYSFVLQFNQLTKCQSVHSKAQSLPFHSQVFDCIIVVTVLMYLSSRAVSETLQEIFRVLKPNGICIIIENNKSGTHFYTLFGLIPKIKSLIYRGNQNEQGRHFAYGELIGQFKALPATLIAMQGCPGFTMGLLPLYGIAKISKTITMVYLRICRRFDKHWGRFCRFSLYIAYTLRRQS